MNDLQRIPCVLMRAGTSRGPFFLASDLPQEPQRRDAILLAAMGSGHELQIDGIGGGHPLTSKVAIVGPSRRPDADVDYLFAQVNVYENVVDTGPNCGNMLAGVGPFAIESGLVIVESEMTMIRIHNVNTGKVIEARIPTANRSVAYRGATSISGVPGSGAPIALTFLDSAGSKTGALLPTGAAKDMIEGIEVSCIDAAMPVVLIRARDLGKTAMEMPAELNRDRDFLQRLENIRITAGKLMGLADTADRVIPKPILIAKGTNGAHLTTRYFMPHQCHTALAITGSIALASACATLGTIAAELCGAITLPVTLSFAHSAGRLDVAVEMRDGRTPVASVIRTARRLFEGAVLVRPEQTALNLEG
ncbi:4-oxalomesaconate tautomerase [Pseudochelatococcus sp. B33]